MYCTRRNLQSYRTHVICEAERARTVAPYHRNTFIALDNGAFILAAIFSRFLFRSRPRNRMSRNRGGTAIPLLAREIEIDVEKNVSKRRFSLARSLERAKPRPFRARVSRR